MRANNQIHLVKGTTKMDMASKDVKQQAVCLCCDLWSVQTINTYRRNTLVYAKTAKEAKKKVQNYLTDDIGKLIWAQHTPYLSH